MVPSVCRSAKPPVSTHPGDIMNLAAEIRKAVLQGRRKEIQLLLISDDHIELDRNVAAGRIKTSTQLANALGITLQTAHGRLNRLAKAGYVERDKRRSPSGGNEWVYSVD